MTFLPIVGRELTEASRRRGTYWMRLAVAAIGLIIGGWVLLVMHRAPSNALGIALFVALSISAYVYCLFIGVFRTADCLSEEKREGTLGLLFLTDLKGYDIVFGKLAATSLNAFYGVLALFPVMAIPLLLGGVSIHEFWRVVLAALNLLFFSLAVGMFCSSVSRDERRAMGLAFLTVLLMTFGLPLLAAILQNWPETEEPGRWLFVPSPGYAAFIAFAATYGSVPFQHYATSMLIIHGISWLLLVAACAIVPRTWQDKTETAKSQRRRELWNRMSLGTSHGRRTFRTRLLDLNPFYWLVARHRMKAASLWAFLALVGIIWALGLTFNPSDWKQDELYVFTALVVHTVLKFWLASESSRRFSLDRQSGAMELLLSTPIQVREILRGQWMGLERQFVGPVLVVLLADFIFLMACRHVELLVWGVGMIVFLADLVALGWLGMWRGLNSRYPNRAAAAALVRILFLPWTLFILILTVMGVTHSFGPAFDEKAVMIMWGMISLLVNVLFAVPARRKLYERFRQIAAERFAVRTRK